MTDDYLTVGTLKRWFKDYKLPDDTKIYVQMPSDSDLKAQNLCDVEIKESELPYTTDRYVRAWGPHLYLKEKKKNLYIDIWY